MSFLVKKMYMVSLFWERKSHIWSSIFRKILKISRKARKTSTSREQEFFFQVFTSFLGFIAKKKIRNNFCVNRTKLEGSFFWEISIFYLVGTKVIVPHWLLDRNVNSLHCLNSISLHCLKLSSHISFVKEASIIRSLYIYWFLKV